MSRLKNFARGVFSGYLQLAANIVFTLASVPLALHYLSKEEFALWALVTQITSYFGLIDLGMSISVARTLADYKDDRDGGRYGGVLQAGAIVFTVQGIVVALSALLLAAPLATAFSIAPALREEFIFLLSGHGLIVAFGFATRVFGAPFWGFQRYDIANYGATFGFLLQFLVLWLGFSAGNGVRSMLACYVATTIFSLLWSLGAGLRLGLYPQKGGWGRIDPIVLRDLFRYGRDVFLMSVGVQLLSGSQIMIVTRLLGLDAAATWAICSKIFTLAQQMVSRILDSSAGAFTEMFVRKEHERLKSRFRDVVGLSGSLSVVAGVMGAAVNPSFVDVWTRGRVAWPASVDLLLGILLIITCVSRCFTGVAGFTKEIRLFRLVYFFEGLTFVGLAWVAGARFGFAGIALASIVATIVWSGLYGFIRVRRQWQCSNREVLGWLAPAGRVLIGLLPTAVMLRWRMSLQPSGWEFAVLCASLGLTALALVWWAGFPPTLKSELTARLSARRVDAL